MAVLDASGGNPTAQLTAAPHVRPKVPYAWQCTDPGCPGPREQVGFVEDGCQVCGAGKGGEQRGVERPMDFVCRACRGSGTVERKCGGCLGSGIVGLPEEGKAPEGCEACGGAGTMAFPCARCDGGGIDPEPQPAGELTQAPAVVAEGPAIPKIPVPPMPATSAAGIFAPAPLPSIDEPAAPAVATVVRYRLLRYEGRADDIDQTIQHSLDGHWIEASGTQITAVEIAPPSSPALQLVLEQTRTRPAQWMARTKY